MGQNTQSRSLFLKYPQKRLDSREIKDIFWLYNAFRVKASRGADMETGPETAQIVKQMRPFTDREMNILQLLARGLTNVQIGAELSISKYTVAQHVAAMLDRTRSRTRAHLVAKAYEHGLFADSPPRHSDHEQRSNA